MGFEGGGGLLSSCMGFASAGRAAGFLRNPLFLFLYFSLCLWFLLLLGLAYPSHFTWLLIKDLSGEVSVYIFDDVCIASVFARL